MVFYCLKQGLMNIWKNKIFSLASVATMSACIFLFGIIFSVVMNFQETMRDAEQSVTITVFFDEGISDVQIEAIGQEIEKRAEVSDIVFVSAEEALQQYIDEYLNGSEEAAEGLAEDNPLANSANFEVYLNDISMQSSLASYIESLDGVRQVNQSVVAANILSDFNKLVGYISVAIILILLAVAIFLINNTIAVGITVRKEEIAIMKLIGATDLFIRVPFLIEGMLIGLMGSAIPLVILHYLYNGVTAYIGKNFNFLSDILVFMPAGEVFGFLVPVALVLGVGIGFLGSILTMRKHLDV
ncbi:MAG: permease-like cell division protein FtsX [Eubacterium sp.]|nr:permease-like cell division protein FtsX [Eubacterium sp.]